MKGFCRLSGAALATCFGSGYSPVAPGTVGSLLGALVFILISRGHLLLLAPVIAVAWIGCGCGWRLWGKDPSKVNIDEFAGCWVACLASRPQWGLYGMTAAFLLFRVMDIVKPWPVSLLDRIDSPLGILADDLAAGLLAAGALLVAGMLLPW